MSDPWRNSRPTARNPHRCDQCSTTIQPGTAYHRGEGLYDGEWQTRKTCIPCADLAREMYAAGIVGERAARGTAKLRESDIPRIRDLRTSGLMYREIAAEYGVSTGAIMHACQRRTWRHVA